MFTTDDHHHDDAHDQDEDLPVHHVTVSELPGLIDAFRAAVHAARTAADAFHAHGIGPDRVTVAASLTDDGQPLVIITATTPTTTGTTHDRGGADVSDRHHWLTQRLQHAIRRTNVGGGGGGPPAHGTNRAGRAA